MGWPSSADFAAAWVRPLIFQRTGTRVPASETDLAIEVDGATLRGWVTNPGAERAVVYFGGNAEQVGLYRDIVEAQFPHHATYLLAYRGYGASDGEPSEIALVHDGLAVVDEVARRHPGAPVSVIGRSLGSGVAVQVAVHRPAVGRLVLVTPFDSLAGVIRDIVRGMPVGSLVSDRFDSARVAGQLTMPTLVVRAGRDEVVLPPRTDALVAALPPKLTRVVDFLAADHNSISAYAAYWKAIRGFLDEPPAADDRRA